MNGKNFKLSFDVGFVGGNLSDDVIDLVLESIKFDIKRVLNKNAMLCSNLIHSKNINCVKIDSTIFDDVGGD